MRMKFVGYDRACDLHPFLKSLCMKGNQLTEEFLEGRPNMTCNTILSCQSRRKEIPRKERKKEGKEEGTKGRRKERKKEGKEEGRKDQT